MNSACRCPSSGKAPDSRTLGDADEGPGPIKTFVGTLIGLSRISGGEEITSVFIIFLDVEYKCEVWCCFLADGQTPNVLTIVCNRLTQIEPTARLTLAPTLTEKKENI